MHSAEAFQIYASCMYCPSAEKYVQTVDGYLSDPETHCFGAFDGSALTGILIVRSGEILGIAVREGSRRKGVGRALIDHAAQQFSTLSAETDGDAVDFYRVCGFECTGFERSFPDGVCVRYQCIKKLF